MTETQLQPTAEGNLTETPFAHLVLYLYQHRSSGTLIVTEPAMANELGRVLFQRGRGIAARVPAPAESLEPALLRLCAVRDAAFSFYEDDLVGSGTEVLTGMFDPYAFVAASVRTHPRADAIEGVLSRYGESSLRLQPGVDISRFRLTGDEAKLVEVLRAEPISVRELCLLSELPTEAARRLIYVLIVTKAVAPYERPPDAAPTSPAPRSGATSPGTVSAAPPSATPSAPPAQPTEAERRPSVLSIPQPAATGSSWQTIAARVGAAASLRPPTVSPTSITTKSTPATPRPSMAPVEVLDLAGKVKRVEQLCQRRSFDEALPIIRAVCAEAPNQAKHQGLLALVMLSRTTDTTAVSKEIVETVNHALRLDEDEPNALYAKALCYKRGGKEREAVHYFKRTVAVDPTNIDAAREVRLFSMRTQDDKKTKR